MSFEQIRYALENCVRDPERHVTQNAGGIWLSMKGKPAKPWTETLNSLRDYVLTKSFKETNLEVAKSILGSLKELEARDRGLLAFFKKESEEYHRCRDAFVTKFSKDIPNCPALRELFPKKSSVKMPINLGNPGDFILDEDL